MALTHDNHYVPRLYLKNFASATGEICMFRTLVSHPGVPIWEHFNATGMGYQRDLYTRIASGEETDDIEKWMSRDFETPAEEPIRKVAQDEELTASDWNTLIRFLAAQVVRTPAFLVENLRRWNQMMPGFLNQTMKDVEREFRLAKESGQKIAPAEAPNREYFPMRVDRVDIPEENSAQISTKIAVGRGLWFYSMKHILTGSKSLQVLHKHKWAILSAPEGLSWFTTDDPVVRLNFQSESCYNFDGGWGNPGTQILLPLSPRHLMYTRISAASAFRTPTPSRFHARFIRRMIAEHAYRQIYSASEDGKISTLRPRIVDAEAFQHEKEQWEKWHEEQTRVEQELQRGV